MTVATQVGFLLQSYSEIKVLYQLQLLGLNFHSANTSSSSRGLPTFLINLLREPHQT